MYTYTQKLSEMLRNDLSERCSSAAYAIMVDGKILAEDSMGRNPIRGGTYNVGSISKVYCAVAVMQLVERGLLGLDDPIYQYLPRFWMPDERYKQITMRHCLSHSSGLPGTQWRWLAASTPRKDYYEEVYRFLSHSALHSNPGEFSVYCNDGFTLAEMVISELTGMEYGEYCMKYITEPIGAHSSRQSSQRNTDYPHTFIVGMPQESIGPEGAGGIGSTMSDLCLFGQLFLEDNLVISELSKKEINRPQGTTFLAADEWSPNYGLGWDSVDMPHQEYSLGCGVLDKGGGTKEFSSRLLVIPKYKAVLAISATYDCGIDVKEEILQMFAVLMAERGINIWKDAVPVDKEIAQKNEGTYLASGRQLQAAFYGARMDLFTCNARGERKLLYRNLLCQDGEFVWKKQFHFLFSQQDGVNYLFAKVQGRKFPFAVRAKECKGNPVGTKWNQRLGKLYLICNVFPEDLIGSSELNAFELYQSKEAENILIASFVNDSREDKRDRFEVPLTPYKNEEYLQNLAVGAILVPYQAGRDLLNLFFEEKDGISYCECSGYRYRAVDSLEEYKGQLFGSEEENTIYRIQHLTVLPEIPQGRRILLFNQEGSVVYDSLMNDHFEPLEQGYISLI